jgi:hypothetical protein
MPDAHEQEVALSEAHALCLLSAHEVLGRNVRARLQPGSATEACHVEQHTATDDPISGNLDR